MKTIDDYNFKDKKALIRVDFNVPLDNDGLVTDATRIEAAKPTIEKIIGDGGSCILMSHLGRPKGQPDPEFSLRHIIYKIQEVLGKKINFTDDCIGPQAKDAAAKLQPGEILLLENLRFHAEEEKGDHNFSAQLAELGDIYVNDAFGTAHRAHASTTIVAQFFPDNKCFGYLMGGEVKAIDKVMSSGEKPVLAVLGGAKISTKIPIVENIIDKVNHLIIGGGMAFTFIKAKGGQIGDSICEDDMLAMAISIMKKAEDLGVKIHLPEDVIAADSFDDNANTGIVDANKIPNGWQGLDAGPKTRQLNDEVVNASKTILWNGPVGVFELDSFSKGTISLGESIARATKNGAFSLVGGGDSVAAVKKFGFTNKVSYVSTGGGAMLESLEGKLLPGIAAIADPL